jgi:hypothetical protein
MAGGLVLIFAAVAGAMDGGPEYAIWYGAVVAVASAMATVILQAAEAISIPAEMRVPAALNGLNMLIIAMFASTAAMALAAPLSLAFCLCETVALCFLAAAYTFLVGTYNATQTMD